MAEPLPELSPKLAPTEQIDEEAKIYQFPTGIELSPESAAFEEREVTEQIAYNALATRVGTSLLTDIRQTNRGGTGLVISFTKEVKPGQKAFDKLVINDDERQGLPEDVITWFGGRATRYDELVSTYLADFGSSRLNAEKYAQSHLT